MARFVSAQSSGGEWEEAPAGTHIAWCIRLIDLGTQRVEYQGEVSFKQKLFVTWELQDELMKSGKPFLVSHFYVNSLHEKSRLRADLSAWRGRDFTEAELARFDLESILGKPCLLSVTHNEKGRARVAGVLKPLKSAKLGEPVNNVDALWLDEHFDQNLFDSLSEGLRNIVSQSPEYQQIAGGGKKAKAAATVDDIDDDIPF